LKPCFLSQSFVDAEKKRLEHVVLDFVALNTNCMAEH